MPNNDLDKSVLEAADAYRQTAPPPEFTNISNLPRIKSGRDIPPNSVLAQPDDTRGYWHSLANSIGVPVNMQEAPSMLTHDALMYNPGTAPFVSSWNAAKTIYNDPSWQGVNRAFNPLAGPMEQAGGGNIKGALGSATPFVASMLAAPFIPKAGPPKVGPGFAPDINLISPRPNSNTVPMQPKLGVTTEPPSAGARFAEYAVREPVSKIPLVGTKLSDSLKGSIAKPRKGTGVVGLEPRPRQATSLSATYPEGPGTDFPFNSTNAPVQSTPPSNGSVPLNNPQDIMTRAGLPQLWQNEVPPFAQAAFGDAPTQPISPIAGPHPSGVQGLNLPNVAKAKTSTGTYFHPGEFEQLMEQLRRAGASRTTIHDAQQQGISNIIKDELNNNPAPNATLKAVAAARKAKKK